MRNRAEKQRRDKLNAYISELYTLVPSAASAPRKLDKTSTLRLSANFLRLHQSKSALYFVVVVVVVDGLVIFYIFSVDATSLWLPSEINRLCLNCYTIE